MNNRYDVIVVGAGPAGAQAALHAALQGVSVLILEKDREVGIPVRCAEGVGGDGLREFVEPSPDFVRAEINKVRLIAPDNASVELSVPVAGYVLDRKVFDARLCQMAAEAGAHIRTRSHVVDVLRDHDAVTGVVVEQDGGVREIGATIVIGADGIESRVGRMAGMHTAMKVKDLESCAQVTLVSNRIQSEFCDFYFGHDVAPGGYAWVFPKGNNSANVGLGICGAYAKEKSAKQYLQDFLSRRFPDRADLTTVCGGVAAAVTLKQITGAGIMLAGDAAHQTNPLTGGGIVNAMKGGRIAGQVAGNAILTGDASAEWLEQYRHEWMDLMGDAHVRYYRLKEAVNKFSDNTFNKLARVLKQVPPDDLTLKNVFLTALKEQPSLLLDVAKVWW
jgi:digeranylgeranylglycerophospholipid reductase